MPDYSYEGISREGEKIKGILFAENETELRIKLRSQKIRPTRITEKSAPARKGVKKITQPSGTFSIAEKTFFAKQLLVMFRSGLSITQALEVMVAEGGTALVRDVARTTLANMEKGMTFSQALAKFPNHFDTLFLNLTASGELRGNLEEALEKWLTFFKLENEINKSTTRTILYPLAVISIILIALFIVVLGIAPVFELIYRTYNQPIPLSLLTMSTIGSILKENLAILSLLFFIFAIASYLLFRSRLLKLWVDGTVVKLPLMSELFNLAYTLKTILTVSLALRLNLSLQRALELATEKIGNHIYEEWLLKAREAASKNEYIAPFLARSKLFKPMVVQVFSVGEITGALPDMLDELAPFLMDELKRIGKFFSSVIEPMILLLGGILIGAILTSFFMPVFTILSQMR
ncbi:MAG: type II secretion system F family protein [Oligoflexia bacterium]|nr:type II secretion system F family protein [Oligoflexia bacterium]